MLEKTYDVTHVDGGTLAYVSLANSKNNEIVIVGMGPEMMEEFAEILLKSASKLRDHPYWKGCHDSEVTRNIPSNSPSHSNACDDRKL